MQQWIHESLSADLHGLAVLPAAFLLGLFAAVSSCCTLPVIGAVAGYAGSIGGRHGRRGLLLIGLALMVGTALSLAAVGAVTGFLGQVAGAALGRYWRFAGGLMMVLFGLSTLRLLNVRVPRIEVGTHVLGGGMAGALIYGLAVGGATTACSLCCNPLLPVALGAAAMKGAPVLGAAMLALFALGYSLPLAGSMVGIGFGMGRLGLGAQRIMPVVNAGFGLLLIGVGFYLLATG